VDSLTAYRNHLMEMAKLGSAISLLGWDQHTHMPKKGVAFRSQVAGKLNKMLFELSVSDELGELLKELEKRQDLSEAESGSVRRVGKTYRRRKAVPPEFVEEQTVARSQAQAAWAKARGDSDFAAFEPHLKKMVDFARRLADYYGYEEHPYDALLEDFEPGMTCAELRGIIEPLREELVPFLKRLTQDGTAPDACPLSGTFDIETQRRLARRALEVIGYDFDAGGLADVPHPFTTTIGPGDVRVTNRYSEELLGPGLFAALHEGGHALYNQGMGEELFALGIARGASNGIHESQSRMIENQLGRSRSFWVFFAPILAEYFPELADTEAEALYRAANVAGASLIRVEADEVTYNLHIMLRFELETGLIEGSMDVADLPRLWNETMERYLGIVPPNDALGVMQDVHWAMGAFGYFPSYMLGNLYAAQMLTTLREQIPNLDDQIAVGNLSPLLDWLRSNVHELGGICEPKELIERITGDTLDASHFVRYVSEKYSDIYDL
jgi:carboxypeptidase Taq